MIHEPVRELRRICKFAHLDRSEDLLRKVIARNSIDSMKQKAKKYHGMGHFDWVG